MKLFSKLFLFIIGAILLLAVAGYFIWQKYKYKIVNDTVSTTVAKQTDSLYTIKYDSLSFDEVTGNASMKNIRITPDTDRVKKLNGENIPDILLDVTIKSLTVKGVKTAKALAGKQMEGDTVIIDNPEIIMYSLKPLQKKTQIESEADIVYKQILGKLDLIKVGFIFVNNVNVKGIDFYSKEKNFDFINGKFLLEGVFIDSAHHLDTNRILFCRQAAFTVDSFFSYNNGRKELSVRDVNFLGKQQSFLVNQISVDRFENDTSKGIRLLDAKTLKLSGVNTNEIIKNKNLKVDSILCENIIAYQLPLENLKPKKDETTRSKDKLNDSTGFRNVYSVEMKYLNFPKVTFVPFSESNFVVGNIAIKINDVKTDKVKRLENSPMDYSKEVEVAFDKFSMKSKDGLYNFDFKNITINSLRKDLNIHSFSIIPFASERQFANKSFFQKDRYDVQLSNLSLKNIDMNNLINKKLIASELVIDNSVVKIYRDLHKPLEKKSKVGNYPSQMLVKFDVPINIAKTTLNNAFIQYRENESLSDSVGQVEFVNSNINISNITNIPSEIQKNGELNVSFTTKVLGTIPMRGNFKYSLNKDGNFVVNGHSEGFDALKLNTVSVPMALIRINTGTINSIDFNFTGNDTTAGGNFVMKYNDLKIDVLKRDKDSKEIKKRGLTSLAANIIVKNDNPRNGDLRKVTAHYNRDIHKSFFNLVWKTIFEGMKSTVGIP